MKQPRPEDQRLNDSKLQPYQPTTLNLQPYESWIEDWQVKLAELQARRIQ